MRKKLVLYLWGRALLVFAACLIVPFLMTIYTSENRLAEFGIPILISIALGKHLSRGDNPYNGRLSIREGIALVGIGFFIICILGTLPFAIAGFPLIDSFFESVSGFTTTGASVLGDLSLVPPELLLWRSLSQWLGGIYIVLVFVTLVPQVGRDAMKLFTGELHGESAERILPRIVETIKALCIFYVSFTGLIVIGLYLAGMNLFEACNYAMTIVSTGGFSIYNDGLARFNSMSINLVVLFCMFVAGGNYVLYFRAYQEGWRKLVRDSEYKGYLLLITVASFLVVVALAWSGVYSWSDSVFHGIFQTVSIITTSGFAVGNYNSWPDFTKFCLFLLMFVGGCSGSTVGGIKVSRAVILLKSTWEELKRTIHPHMVTKIDMSGVNVPLGLREAISVFFFLYIVIFFVAAATLSLVDDLSIFSAAGISASCLASVGSAFETVASISGYAVLNTPAKIIAIITMILGRLEIFTVCVLFSPDFWDKKKIV